MKKYNPNRIYTRKYFEGNLISSTMFTENLEQDQEQKRKKLIEVCQKENIELKLCNPRLLYFGEKEPVQIRSTFYLEGNYPEWYFYKVNQVQAMALDRLS